MSEPVSAHTFRERWDRATEQLWREHSLDGFLQMHENGEVSALELLNFAYKHWYECPEYRAQFLTDLANHHSEDIREVAERLSSMLAKYGSGAGT